MNSDTPLIISFQLLCTGIIIQDFVLMLFSFILLFITFFVVRKETKYIRKAEQRLKEIKEKYG